MREASSGSYSEVGTAAIEHRELSLWEEELDIGMFGGVVGYSHRGQHYLKLKSQRCSQYTAGANKTKHTARTYRATGRAVNTVTEVSRGVVPNCGGGRARQGSRTEARHPFADVQERPARVLEILCPRRRSPNTA